MATQPLDRASDLKALPSTPSKSSAAFHVLLKNSNSRGWAHVAKRCEIERVTAGD